MFCFCRDLYLWRRFSVGACIQTRFAEQAVATSSHNASALKTYERGAKVDLPSWMPSVNISSNGERSERVGGIFGYSFRYVIPQQHPEPLPSLQNKLLSSTIIIAVFRDPHWYASLKIDERACVLFFPQQYEYRSLYPTRSSAHDKHLHSPTLFFSRFSPYWGIK